jgi:Copper transport outer membrane protein, MctB
MINFRFHIASLIAVFFALAVGVLMGSTVVQRAIVDSLRDQIHNVEKNVDDQRADNRQLRSEKDELNLYVTESAPWAVAGQLTNQPVALVAERGVNEDSVKAQAALLGQSGAIVPGILWLEPAWNLGGDGKASDALRTAIGSTAQRDKILREEAETALARRLARGAAVPGEPDVLDALAKAGFVTLEGIGDGDVTASSFPGPGARSLLLGGPQSSITAAGTTRDLTRALVTASVPTAVGEIDADGDNAPERGVWLAPIRNDDQLKTTVSTIDDVELVQGQVAAALALSDLGRGVVGDYGLGAGAKRTVPERAGTG